MSVLVTGGAGYIGSIVVEELIQQGYEVVVLDNLQEGNREAVSPAAVFVEGNIADRELLLRTFAEHGIESVIHMAAETTIEFSMTDPQRYFVNNVLHGINLLDVMLASGVKKIVFSSTAAIYGEPKQIPITETHPTEPINAYGESKLMFEKILKWYHQAYGINYACFRYFNAAGASENYGENHRHESHLIPMVLQAALAARAEGPAGKAPPTLEVFGTDYPTKDGSCIRDYIHVVDLAQAHVLALEHIDNLKQRAFNLGNGGGYSVLEVIEMAERVTGVDIPVAVKDRRSGDPGVLIASSALIKKELGWQPKYPDLKTIIESAWDWCRKHPQGYGNGSTPKAKKRPF
jgi:UDP-glucose 4-epimerase